MTRSPRRARWLVFGHYGGLNTGDDAMLAGLVSAVGRECSLTIVSKDGRLPPGLAADGVRSIKATPVRVLREVARSTGLVLGGGTHFHDDYSPRRYRRHALYMLRLTLFSIVGRLLGKPVFWLGIGIGPLERRTARLITAWGLRASTGVSVRDRASAHEIEQLEPGVHPEAAFDLAALIPTEDFEPDRPPVLGISVTSLSRTFWGGGSTDRVFREMLAESLAVVALERDELEIRIIGFRGGEREDDTGPSLEIIDGLKSRGVSRVSWVPYDPDPSVVLRTLRGCRWLVAMRYHAGVLGYLAGCRLLLLAYHRKVGDFADEIGLDSDSILHLDRGVTKEELLTSLTRLLIDDRRGRPALSRDVAAKRAVTSIDLLR